MKNIKLLTLFIIIPLLYLYSCAGNVNIMTYGRSAISERIYNYWFTTYKAYFLSSIEETEDTEKFWTTKVNPGSDLTMDGYFKNIININVMKNLVCLKLFDDNNLKLPDDVYKKIGDDMNDIISSYGGRAEFNKYLSAYNINDRIYKEIMIIQEKINFLYQYLYGAGGIVKLTDDEIENYFINNYYRIKYISVNLFDIDENGRAADISNDERLKRIGYANNIYNEIINGADFNGFFLENPNELLTEYPNGLYFSNANKGSHIVFDTAAGMEINEVKLITDEYVVYIVIRLPLETKPYMNDDQQFYDLISLCSQELFQEKLYEYIDEVVINENIMKNYSLQTSQANYQ